MLLASLVSNAISCSSASSVSRTVLYFRIGPTTISSAIYILLLPALPAPLVKRQSRCPDGEPTQGNIELMCGQGPHALDDTAEREKEPQSFEAEPKAPPPHRKSSRASPSSRARPVPSMRP